MVTLLLKVLRPALDALTIGVSAGANNLRFKVDIPILLRDIPFNTPSSSPLRSASYT